MPSEFILYIKMDSKAFNCRVCWRRDNEIGVEFQGPTERPSWYKI